MANGDKLNVILHGTFAYIDKENVPFIDALIPRPDEKMDHVFRAGNWLGETELHSGTFQLEGVREGAARLDPAKNLIVKNACPRRPRDPHTEYARLLLPRPQTIASLRLARLYFATRPNNVTGERAPALQVFTYEIESDPLLRLQRVKDEALDQTRPGHYWEPVFTNGYANLHIFSAEDHPDDPEHTSHAFDKTSELLGLRKGQLTLDTVHRADGIDKDDLPAGVIADETEDLAIRMLRMARLGRMRRMRGQDTDLNQVWYENEALDGNPRACLCKACQ